MGERGLFSGKVGFILAAAGSAIGLGNIWRFPHLVEQYGGGIFVLTYLLLVVIFGIVIMITEAAIGRATGSSPIKAFSKINEKYRHIGYYIALLPVLIISYYCVIGGWVVKYSTVYLTNNAQEVTTQGYFEEFISSPIEPLVWTIIFVVLTAGIVWFGVQKGIERSNKIMMPLLFLMLIGLIVYCACAHGGAWLDGVWSHYLKPDFSKLSLEMIFVAMGQVLFSLSLGMGLMIVYGSYAKKEVDLEKSIFWITFFDTFIAIMAGLIIVPITHISELPIDAELSEGKGLLFQTLPKIFAEMPGGSIFAIIFFILVVFAAITSSICFYEAIVAAICDKYAISRKISMGIAFLITILLAIPISLQFGLLKEYTIGNHTPFYYIDFITTNIGLPVCALLICLFVGWVIKPDFV
ncbi:MAG TPA: sodium-dependent transporter, partial [Methanocorpusculum sp.]|nr:sodium-dependent transporter [Methanocorpusculum sp.]